MITGIHIPRSNGNARIQPHGSWWFGPGVEHPRFTCPLCGRGSVMASHAVSPKGFVSPSVGCVLPCTFHAYVTLDDWDLGAKLPNVPVGKLLQ